jgi:hypothetical protein
MDNKKLQTCTDEAWANPDEADWCRVRETVLMLNLAVAQISGAMRDGDESVNVLTESFTTMMGRVSHMAAAAEKLPPSEEQAIIMQECGSVGSHVQQAVIAFQFYDKLSQRLNHLGHSLASFAKLMSSSKLIHDPDAWHLLQEDIKSKYTLETDKAMFDAILEGKTVEEALHHLKNEKSNNDEDIELF